MNAEPRRRDDAVRAEVETTFQVLTEAWIRGDLDTLKRHYHERILGWEPGVPAPIDGREAVLADYRRFLDAGGRIEFLHPLDIRVRPFGETALLTYRFRTRRTLPDGRGSTEFTGRETLLFVRQEGLWKLAHWHYSTDPAGPGEASPD